MSTVSWSDSSVASHSPDITQQEQNKCGDKTSFSAAAAVILGQAQDEIAP